MQNLEEEIFLRAFNKLYKRKIHFLGVFLLVSLSPIMWFWFRTKTLKHKLIKWLFPISNICSFPSRCECLCPTHTHTHMCTHAQAPTYILAQNLSGVTLHEFEFWFDHLLAVWPWINYLSLLASVSLSVIIIRIPTS